MKAITLWQPWAAAIACGSKRVETRGWQPGYRGPLLIHAARREPDWLELVNSRMWTAALAPLGVKFGDIDSFKSALLLGVIVAKCELVDVRPSDSFTVGELDHQYFDGGQPGGLGMWTERMMGDFAPGRYGWMLDKIERFETPIPFGGRQMLFDVPEELLK
jgi:hypothetical protein